MSTYAKTLSNLTNTNSTPQSEIIPGREAEMKINNAGGAVFSVDDWTRLDRFLILGTEGGTYYVQEKPLTIQNAKAVQKCINNDGVRAVRRAVEISEAGRARKNEQALFVVAMAASSTDSETRKAALAVLPKVARIGTHLFNFAEFVKNFRGYGRGLRSAVANWYTDMPVERLALQAIKYQQRNGWSHRDMLRLAHPRTSDEERNNIFKFMVSQEDKLDVDTGNRLIEGYQKIQKCDHSEISEATALVVAYGLPREAIPTEFLNSPAIWEALLSDMPMTAMIRNLGKMSSVGILDPMSKGAKKVIEALSDTDTLRKARIHPMQVLDALKVYQSGHGVRGSLSWRVNQQVVDALNDAFYGTFQFVEPTGKNHLIAVDCSGSMGMNVNGSSVLSCRDAAAALALVTANVESNYEIVGFSSGSGWSNSKKSDTRWGWGSGIQDLKISPKMRLDTVIKTMNALDWGGTDAALPSLYATDTNKEVDVFITITDNETWAGKIHPTQALKQYRQKSGRNTKQVVVGMTASDFSIADPKDAGQMDVVGFDSAVPTVISNFVKN